ncbi:MAG: site-specific integrase, partial [Verrucomicrobiota bacterium]
MNAVDEDIPPPTPEEERYLRFLREEKRVSPLTLRNYGHALREFRKWRPQFAGWEELDAEDFRDYLFDLMKREMGRSTIRLHFSALRGLYQYLA